METSSINLLIEKASGFFGRIVNPGADEFGLLIADKIRSKRVMNQVDILLKVQKYIESKGISIKSIPIKILVPLLENCSLEEDEELKDLWANMLTNMLDSESNFQSHVFPYILSQMSIDDYHELQSLEEEEKQLAENEREMKRLADLESTPFEASNGKQYRHHVNPSDEYKSYKEIVSTLKQIGFNLYPPESDNLQRLGLIRQLPPKIYIPEFKMGGYEFQEGEKWHQIEAEYDQDDYGYRITQLGLSFLEICERNDRDESVNS